MSTLVSPTPSPADASSASAPVAGVTSETTLGHVPRQLVAPLPPSWRTWRPKLTAGRLIFASALAALAVLACWWAWVDLVGLIDLNGHNGHIVLVPVAIAVLVWVRRRRIAYIRVGTRLLGPVIALVGIICLLSGGSAGVSYLYHAGAVLVALCFRQRERQGDHSATSTGDGGFAAVAAGAGACS